MADTGYRKKLLIGVRYIVHLSLALLVFALKYLAILLSYLATVMQYLHDKLASI